MSRLYWKVAGALTLGYVVLTLVGVTIGSKIPELSAAPSVVAADFAAATTGGLITATYVSGLALLLMLPVATFLARGLRAAAGASGWMASTALAGGVAFVLLNGLDPILLAASVYGAHHGVGNDSVVMVNLVRNFVLDGSYMALGVFTVAAAGAVLAGRALPRWIGYAGLVSGVLLFVPPLFGLSFLVGLVWLVALGIAMLAGGPAARTVEEHPSVVPATA